MHKVNSNTATYIQFDKEYIVICDRPQENWPISHLGMIAEIPVSKVVISITSFCLC